MALVKFFLPLATVAGSIVGLVKATTTSTDSLTDNNAEFAPPTQTFPILKIL